MVIINIKDNISILKKMLCIVKREFFLRNKNMTPSSKHFIHNFTEYVLNEHFLSEIVNHPIVFEHFTCLMIKYFDHLNNPRKYVNKF